MSRRGNPYDNAHVESFFKTLKHEEIFANDYSTIDDLANRLPTSLRRYTIEDACTPPSATGRLRNSRVCMQPETLNRSIQPTPTVHPRGFTPRRVRRARHRAAGAPLAALPRSGREHPALFPSEAAGRARGRPRALRLRRSGPRHDDGAPLLGRRAPGPLESTWGAGPRRRDRGRRPDPERGGSGPNDTRQLGSKHPAQPSPMPTPVKKSPGSSRPSCKARSGSSRSSAVCRPP